MGSKFEEGVSLGTVQFDGETDAAVAFIRGDSKTPEWVPKSQIHDDSEIYGDGGNRPGEFGELIVTAWIARQKGWD